MNFSEYIKALRGLVDANSPVLLTGMGVTGVFTTAYLTFKGTLKYVDITEHVELGRVGRGKVDFELTLKEKAAIAWRPYLPAAGSGAVTVLCIIMAHRIGSRRAAAAMAAYSLSERAFSEYKEKVIEKMGEKKEQVVRDEIAQERADRENFKSKEVIITGLGDQLFYDSVTGRTFEATVEGVRKAVNDINQVINTESYATLSDFFEAINLPSTPYSREVGWNLDRLMEVEFSTILIEGRACISIEYKASPFQEYYKLR